MGKKKTGSHGDAEAIATVVGCPRSVVVHVQDEKGASVAGFEANFNLNAAHSLGWKPVTPGGATFTLLETPEVGYAWVRDTADTWRRAVQVPDLKTDRTVVFVFKRCALDHLRAAEPATAPDLVPAPVEPTPEPAPRRSRSKKTA